MSKDPRLTRRFLKLFPSVANAPGAHNLSQRYFFFQARNAIYHGLRALRLSPGDVALLPSYLCAAAIEPVLALRAKVEFYRIDRDCQPDFNDIERRVRPETRVVLAVHYFGFPCDIESFREFCDKRGLLLVEDCAHVFQDEVNGKPLGSYGDISVFSWRKFLPLCDGGELILKVPRELSVTWTKESVLSSVRAAKHLVEQSASHTDSGSLKALVSSFEFAKRGWDHLRRENANPAAKPSTDFVGVEFDPSLVDLPMSRISRWVFRRSDVSAIVAKRRENYAYLMRELSSISGIRMVFPDLGSHCCPWVFPLVFKGIENAHLALRARGISAVTWGGVRHPLVPSGGFPEAEFLYRNLVMLPVHQDLSEPDLHAIVQESRLICRSDGRTAVGNQASAPCPTGEERR
jgi:dTDP-4-amino-4,6-dideoxygalactose transaminase